MNLVCYKQLREIHGVFIGYLDGTSDPLNATKITKDLINDLDGGGYHPVSLVLNCQDYFFADYALGADVLMQDTCMFFIFPFSQWNKLIVQKDPLGINATFSTVWGTPCTPWVVNLLHIIRSLMQICILLSDIGDCGCDNCNGTFQDISTRMDQFKERLDLLGRSRSTTLWTVPQAFGNETWAACLDQIE